jgi:hypothetical protein
MSDYQGGFFWAGGGTSLPGGNGFAVEEKEKGGFFKEEKTACTIKKRWGSCPAMGQNRKQLFQDLA